VEDISVSMVVVTLWETFGWLSVIAAVIGVLLLIMLVTAIWRARTRHLGAWRLLLRGILVTLIVAAILTPFIPVWTLAPVGDLHGLVDVLIAYSFALMPAAIVGVIWVYFGSMRHAQVT
jgi:sulfite exporter TauE/SafE